MKLGSQVCRVACINTYTYTLCATAYLLLQNWFLNHAILYVSQTILLTFWMQLMTVTTLEGGSCVWEKHPLASARQHPQLFYLISLGYTISWNKMSLGFGASREGNRAYIVKTVSEGFTVWPWLLRCGVWSNANKNSQIDVWLSE